uniref:Probable methylthioribulose-1-phosphate dehydratase n=1 Tax=Glycine max TaxID=3847 RepID=I1M370_SOYBN
MAAIGLNGVKVGTTSSQAYLEGKAVKETRALMAELCRHFYTLGWVTGTGGSISMKVHDDSIPRPQQLILMAPSGVQKERMEPEDMYVLSHSGSVLSAPSPKPWPHKPPKCSDCDPLFKKAYEMCDAAAVFHSHGIESCLVTMINPLSKEFRITHMEMIKGIKGHGYYDELVVPIIENTAYEYQLTESFAKAIEDYPKATAVLVRNHGVFVWGDSWISAKTQSECYHYLFDAALKLHQMGLDWSTPNHGPIQSARRGLSIAGESNVSVKARKSNGDSDPLPRCVVLDIEGTTTPISFVSEVLFPYARDNVGRHLSLTYDTPETKADIKLLRSQVYIYSSGSRLAQRLIFGKTNHGDLRKYLSGFFDTTVGNKRETRSYVEISESLGVEKPSDILFVTDVYQEATAATAAGLEVIISIRPGNGPLPDNHGFKTIKSFSEI